MRRFYSKEAVKQINDQICSLFGSNYISNKTFQNQDGAHESIRPTNIQLKTYLIRVVAMKYVYIYVYGNILYSHV